MSVGILGTNFSEIRNSNTFVQENAIENFVWNIAANSPRPQRGSVASISCGDKMRYIAVRMSVDITTLNMAPRNMH